MDWFTLAFNWMAKVTVFPTFILFPTFPTFSISYCFYPFSFSNSSHFFSHAHSIHSLLVITLIIYYNLSYLKATL